MVFTAARLIQSIPWISLFPAMALRESVAEVYVHLDPCRGARPD